jgi:molybdopterin-guanine dinucleotide biosynthesis protein A
MGTPKAALEWHGSTLLYRTAAIVARATGGPVVVVRAAGQDLPELPAGTLVAEDPRAGKGPVQGIAAGLAALAGRAGAAFVASTDLPFLHPAFIARVLRALEDGSDAVLPVARGYRQPLAAAYRTGLAGLAGRLVGQDKLKPGFLLQECTVSRLDDAALLADPVLARLDPALDSLVNVNTPGEYLAARGRPAPEVTVRLPGALAFRAGGQGPSPPGAPGPGAQGPDAQGPGARRARVARVRAATVRAAADAAGLPRDRGLAAELAGGHVTSDPLAPLAQGDVVSFLPAGPARAGGAPPAPGAEGRC